MHDWPRARPARRHGLLLAVAALLAAAPTSAVILAGSDGSANTGPVPGIAGSRNVGARGSLSGVYLGRRWVLTAAHVGAGPFTLDGERYEAVAGSTVVLETAPGVPADLVLFRIDGEPSLPMLEIAARAPGVGSLVVLLGNGRDRGEAITWNGHPGWSWAGTRTLRWGSNSVRSVGPQLALGGRSTHAFSTEFTAHGHGRTAYEAQAANGDSGGAVFVWDPEAGWALGGIMMAITTWAGQPSRAAVSGNVTYAAELSAYREAILEVVEGGAGATRAGRRCGLLGGEPLAVVGWCWGRRRRRRDGARMHEGGR